MQIVKCKVCGKEFNTTNDRNICYDCTLESLTKGQAPEEGDFNTAKILSGEMSEDEYRWLQEDLKRAEGGSSRCGDPDDEPDDNPYYQDDEYRWGDEEE